SCCMAGDQEKTGFGGGSARPSGKASGLDGAVSSSEMACVLSAIRAHAGAEGCARLFSESGKYACSAHCGVPRRIWFIDGGAALSCRTTVTGKEQRFSLWLFGPGENQKQMLRCGGKLRTIFSAE